MRCYYLVLEANRNFSIAEIKKAYRTLVLKYHPDKVPDAEKERATENFREMTEAYTILSDPISKKLYDDTLDRKASQERKEKEGKTSSRNQGSSRSSRSQTSQPPPPPPNVAQKEREEKLRQREQEFENLLSKLNPEQKNAFEAMKSGKNIFVTAPAGAGKSFLIKTFVLYNKVKTKKKVAVTSTTGVSAILINGVTLHSWAGVRLAEEAKVDLLEVVKRNKKAVARWKNTNVLIIDEVSMLSAELLEKLDFIGQNLRNNINYFGGIQLIFSGCFYQLAPVKAEFVFMNPIWNSIIDRTIFLKRIMRQDDAEFQDLLNNIRIGNITKEVIDILKSRVGVKLKAAEGVLPVKLFSHRANAEAINEQNLNRLITEGNAVHIFNAEDTIRKHGVLTTENEKQHFKRIDELCRTSKTIKLCVGCQVMFTFNIDVASGIANGSQAVVIDFIGNIPIVRMVNGMELPVCPVIFEARGGEGIRYYREQIPLQLNWATTIHKCQGSTLNLVQVDLGATLFCAGQGYVALSRCKSLDCISIVTLDPSKIFASKLVQQYYNSIEEY